MKIRKRVIIAADCFNADKLVGSKRITALAGFLLEHNIKPYIITAHTELYRTAVENEALELKLRPVRIISGRFRLLSRSKLCYRLSEACGKHACLFHGYARPVRQDNRYLPSSILLRIFNRVLLLLDHLRADRIYTKALLREKETLGRRYAREASKLISGTGEGCTVITSVGGQNGYYEEGPIEMMKLLLQKYKKLAWIYDMRDKLHSQYADKERNRAAVDTERFILKNAKYVITVSQGERNSLIETLGLTQKEAGKIKVVYNGYRGMLAENETAAQGPERETLNIVYTGKVYPDKFHPELLFKALGELTAEGAIPVKAVRFHYAGSESDALFRKAESCGCGSVYVNHGYVSSPEAEKLQRGADILFGMVRNEGNDTGCLPLKIMEYLGVRRPIIVIISGNDPNAEIKTILEETKAGFVLDEIDFSKNLRLMKNYLIMQYHAKLVYGRTIYDGDENSVLKYSCSKQFMKYLSYL